MKCVLQNKSRNFAAEEVPQDLFCETLTCFARHYLVLQEVSIYNKVYIITYIS